MSATGKMVHASTYGVPVAVVPVGQRPIPQRPPRYG